MCIRDRSRSRPRTKYSTIRAIDRGPPSPWGSSRSGGSTPATDALTNRATRSNTRRMQQPRAMIVAASRVTGQLSLLSTAQFDTVCARIDSPIHSWWGRGPKRAIDIVVSAISLVVLFPLLLILAIGVRLTSGGPAIFVHTRCGERGRPFRFFKFRSMVADAEARKCELIHLNEVQGP